MTGTVWFDDSILRAYSEIMKINKGQPIKTVF